MPQFPGYQSRFGGAPPGAARDPSTGGYPSASRTPKGRPGQPTGPGRMPPAYPTPIQGQPWPVQPIPPYEPSPNPSKVPGSGSYTFPAGGGIQPGPENPYDRPVPDYLNRPKVPGLEGDYTFPGGELQPGPEYPLRPTGPMEPLPDRPKLPGLEGGGSPGGGIQPGPATPPGYEWAQVGMGPPQLVPTGIAPVPPGQYPPEFQPPRPPPGSIGALPAIGGGGLSGLDPRQILLQMALARQGRFRNRMM